MIPKTLVGARLRLDLILRPEALSGVGKSVATWSIRRAGSLLPRSSVPRKRVALATTGSAFDLRETFEFPPPSFRRRWKHSKDTRRNNRLLYGHYLFALVCRGASIIRINAFTDARTIRGTGPQDIKRLCERISLYLPPIFRLHQINL